MQPRLKKLNKRPPPPPLHAQKRKRKKKSWKKKGGGGGGRRNQQLIIIFIVIAYDYECSQHHASFYMYVWGVSLVPPPTPKHKQTNQ